jgi:hypothetical protein
MLGNKQPVKTAQQASGFASDDVTGPTAFHWTRDESDDGLLEPSGCYKHDVLVELNK